MPYIVFQWQDNSKVEDGHRVYRSSKPMNPNALPSPVATLGADVEEFVDETFTDESPLAETLYYRASSYRGSQNLVSEELSLPNPANVLYPDSPTWLFGDGEYGFANTLGLDTLFTDTSGTTPVEEYGDAIALAANLADDGPDMIQATGSDMVQDNSGDEPIYGRWPGGIKTMLAQDGLTIRQSESFGGWSLGNTTGIANADGILGKLVANTSSGGHAAQVGNRQVYSGTTYTAFVVIKAGEESWVQVTFGQGGFDEANIWRNINTSTGDVGNGAGVYEVKPVPAEWVDEYPELAGAYIAMIQAAANASSSASGFSIVLTGDTDASNRAPVFAGDNSSGVYVTRAMMVQGARDIDWYVDNYQRVVADYDISEPGKPAHDIAYSDLTSQAWKWDIPEGPVFLFVAGEKGCVFSHQIYHPGGDFKVGPTSWTGGPADAIPDLIGKRQVIVPAWRRTPFTHDEKMRMMRYAVARGMPEVVGGVVEPPSGLGVSLPFTVTADPWFGGYTTDFNPDDYIVPSDVTYYLAPDGNDSNDGLTLEAPKKSIGALIDTLNASPPAVGATLYLAPGWYHNEDSIAGKSIDFSCNLICEGGHAVLAVTQAPSAWTKTPGYNNIWQRSVSGTSNCVIDLSQLDEYGLPKRLKVIAPDTGWEDLLDATPGALTTGTINLYVHTHDGREPDADVIVFGPSGSGIGWEQTSAQDLYMRGIQIWGWTQPVRVITADVMRLVAADCGFSYSRAGSNGFETESNLVADSGFYLVNCVAAYNSSDGFGYRGAHLAVEIGCKGVYNGWTETNPSDNGSTAHNSVKTVRINGIYRHNNDRNVHDIDNTKNWLVGCVIGDPLNAETDPFNNANLLAGVRGSTGNTRTWVSGCTCTGGAAGDVGAYASAVIVYDTWTGFANRDTADNGQIVARSGSNW